MGATIINPKFHAANSQPFFLRPLAHALLWQAIKRIVNATARSRDERKKVVTYERIFTPSAGCHLSHNLLSAQIQTAKQHRRRTATAVFRLGWKETRLTIPRAEPGQIMTLPNQGKNISSSFHSTLNPVLNPSFVPLKIFLFPLI